MPIPKKDSEKMKTLAKEGKQISKIAKEDFPQYEYWDVYLEINGAGETSAQGVKKMITNRLNRLFVAKKDERSDISDELKELIWYLYNNYKGNRTKLQRIRTILG